MNEYMIESIQISLRPMVPLQKQRTARISQPAHKITLTWSSGDTDTNDLRALANRLLQKGMILASEVQA